MHGWLPIAVQVIAVVVLVVAIGWRSRRWRLVWLPWAALVGVALAVGRLLVHRIAGPGATNPAPHTLWIWIGLSGRRRRGAGRGLARSAVVAARRRRCVGVPLCVLCAALALNLWVGYFPTVQTAWNQLTAGPLPDQTDQVTVVGDAEAGTRFPRRAPWCRSTSADAASGFKHRGELVYLPPAWYATDPPPPLPTVMMIGGEFNTPADWLRAGNAVKTVDDFAAAHGGNAPVLVFVDSGGAFNNDTECVNGTRGNAADHLTKDVVPFMESNFGVSRRTRRTGASSAGRWAAPAPWT